MKMEHPINLQNIKDGIFINYEMSKSVKYLLHI